MNARRRFPGGVLGVWSVVVAGIAVLLSLSGCRHEKPGFTYMPDMAYSPAIKAQKEGSMRQPAPNTIPRGYRPYAYQTNPEEAGRQLKNSLPRTKANLLKGQELYNVYCIVCHGKMGEGDGSVTQAPSGNSFPRPPTLQSDKVRDFSDGRIFHIITAGQNLMSSYASQIEPEERWAIIHYVRALYRAKHPTPEDLKLVGNW